MFAERNELEVGVDSLIASGLREGQSGLALCMPISGRLVNWEGLAWGVGWNNLS